MAASSNSGLTFKLHPLVILNIYDHYTRVKTQTQHAEDSPLPTPLRVFGCVIGVQKGRTVEIFNNFELLYDQDTQSLVASPPTATPVAAPTVAPTTAPVATPTSSPAMEPAASSPPSPPPAAEGPGSSVGSPVATLDNSAPNAAFSLSKAAVACTALFGSLATVLVL